MTRTLLPILAAATWLVAFSAPASAADAGRTYRGSFGGIGYVVYEPSAYRRAEGPNMGLVMGLHGCGGDADFFNQQTRLTQRAESDARNGRGYIVVLPEKKANLKCWSFTSSTDDTRDPDYPASLASANDPNVHLNEPTVLTGIARKLIGQYNHDAYPRNIDTTRIYAMGFSAGAAMAVILGVTYPDVFAAIGVHSGCEYRCGFFQVDPQRAGDAAYDAMPMRYRRVVPVLAIVGTDDRMAPPKNTDNAITAWAQTNDRTSDGLDNDNITDVVPLPPRNTESVGTASVYRGRSYEHTIYRDARDNTIVMEKYVVDGMGHDWSGGPSGLSYSDPRGPDATRLILNFLQAHKR